nr:MAG TPA: hypothetical protein [Caudoviricetes sp.]
MHFVNRNDSQVISESTNLLPRPGRHARGASEGATELPDLRPSHRKYF